jgi:tetratricopeptide (TPR) repeat protein
MRVRTLLAVVILAWPAWGDVVRLKDGSSITGDIKKTADGWVVTDAHGKVTHVSADAVQSLELAPRGDAKDIAASRLISLRRSVDALGDLKQIIDRFQKFIDQNKEFPAAADARKDLAIWKDRLAKGMVKVGTNWVTPDERATLQEKALLVADQARDLLKQNKVRDADAALTKALETDPTNVSALYLKGLIAYKQDQIPAARKAFEAVREVMPDHGPALNNLAVILWRQNQPMAAIAVYVQAMQAMPVNRELLNNVAEALNALTEDQRRSQLGQKAIKIWTEQDAQLQQLLMSKGLYRWGATWVNKEQYDKLQAAEKEVKDKMAKLESDFADAQSKVDTIDAQIRQNQDAMRYMEQQRYLTDNTGRTVTYPLPPQYWDYDRANRRLDVQKKEAIASLDAMRAKAQVLKDQLPTPKFTGAQLIMGVEGTPAIAPADKPATPVAVENLAGELTAGTTPPAVSDTAKPAAGNKPVTTAPTTHPTPPPHDPPKEKPLKY